MKTFAYWNKYVLQNNKRELGSQSYLKESKSLKVEVATFMMILKVKICQRQPTKTTFMWEHFNEVAYQEKFHILKNSIKLAFNKNWQLLSFDFKKKELEARQQLLLAQGLAKKREL